MKALILLALSSSLALASTQLTLESAIQRVWRDSPQLRELETLASLAERDQLRRFFPNEPQLTLQRDESDQSRSIGVQLNVGFPGKAFAYSRLDSALSKKQRLERLARKHELAVLITQGFLDCAAAQATVEIREGTLSDLETLFHSLKVRRGVTQMEKLSFELETRGARRELTAARDTNEVSCQKFQTLISGAPGSVPVLPLPDDVDPSLVNELGPQTADESRSLANTDLADAAEKTAWWAQMPDLSLSYAQKQSNAKYNVYGLAVTIPLFFPLYESTEANRAKSQAAVDRETARLQKLQAEAEKADASRNFLRSRNHLKELRTKDLPLGQALLESAYSAYRAGQLGYADMALSRKTLIELKLKEIELRTAIVSARLKCLSLCEGSKK